MVGKRQATSCWDGNEKVEKKESFFATSIYDCDEICFKDLHFEYLSHERSRFLLSSALSFCIKVAKCFLSPLFN